MNKPVLDMTAGGRMMWTNKNNPLVLANDIRYEIVGFVDSSVKGGVRELAILPNVQADWSKERFKDTLHLENAFASFDQIMFDPPHLIYAGPNSWLRAKYGVLNKDTWRDDIKAGFQNAANLLRANGTLLFKWNSDQIPLKEVLALVPDELVSTFQNQNGKTYLISFIKVEESE